MAIRSSSTKAPPGRQVGVGRSFLNVTLISYTPLREERSARGVKDIENKTLRRYRLVQQFSVVYV